jgi:exodeoxyribonuclease V gamma subunit
VDFRERIEEMEDREPISLDALARFDAGEYLLAGKLRGVSAEDIYPILKGRGKLPLGAHGRIVFEDLDHEAGLLADNIREAFGTEEMLSPVSAETRMGGFWVTGTIDRLTAKGRIVHTFGKLNEGRKIELWITHLFMNIVAPMPCPATSLMVGRGGKGPERCRFDVLPDAGDLLRDLLKVYRLGLSLPLPLFPVASCAYARAFLKAGEKSPEPKVMASIMGQFQSGRPEHSGESAHPAVRRLFGTRNPLMDVGEAGFAELAVRVFGPMLEAEGEGTP